MIWTTIEEAERADPFGRGSSLSGEVVPELPTPRRYDHREGLRGQFRVHPTCTVARVLLLPKDSG